jgi:low affinity Fe/Cu permease
VKAKTYSQGAERDTDGSPHTSVFERFAKASVRMTGHPATLCLALSTIVIWGITGPIFHFSDTWQLVINTATTIVTFLMVFLIQNAQNRDNEAIQLKLDELIRATEAAHNAFLDVEEISEPELDQIKLNFGQLAKKAREDVRSGKSDLGCPEVGRKPGGAGATRHDLSNKQTPATAGTQHKGKE